MYGGTVSGNQPSLVGPDLLPLALAEGREDLPSEHLGAHVVRIGRGCPRRSQLQGLDGGLVDPPQRPLVAADQARPDLLDVAEIVDALLSSRKLAEGRSRGRAPDLVRM
jgi:hypothetical protein